MQMIAVGYRMDQIVIIFIAVFLGMVVGAILVALFWVLYRRQETPAPIYANEPEALTEVKPPSEMEVFRKPAPSTDMMSSSPESPALKPPIPDAFSTIESIAPPQNGMPWLEGVGGMVSGQKIVLYREENILGRSRVCDIQFQDPKVSRQHAMVRLYRGHYFLQDMQSSRGTLVNSQPIQTHLLQNGDQIRLGDTVLVFHLPES